MTVHDTEEPDTCRICSAPAEPGQPLFHPCKCSGTIRYIHQDCLTTWLAHSKKKTCDVCKYQYNFTKVYASNMPKQLPIILFLRRLVKQTVLTCLLAFRAAMVATVWLAFLPWMTVWIWRFCFFVGGYVAYWINERSYPHASPFTALYTNATTVPDSNGAPIAANTTLLDIARSYPMWLSLSSDIFTGQIIASLIVLTFLGVFLLREWIVQNARPGVFEDNEVERELQQEGQEAPVAQMPANVQPVEPVEANQLMRDEPLSDEASTVVSEASSESFMTFPASEKNVRHQDGTTNFFKDVENSASHLSASSSKSTITKNSKGKSPYRFNFTGMPNEFDIDANDRPRRRRRLSLDRDIDKYRRKRSGFPRLSSPSQRFRSTRESREKGKQVVRSSPLFTKSDDGIFTESMPLTRSLSADAADFEFDFNVDSDSSWSELRGGHSETQLSTSFSFAPPPNSTKLFDYEVTQPLPHPFTPSPSVEESKSLPQMQTASSSDAVTRPLLPTTHSFHVPTDRPLIIDLSSPSAGPRVITFENGIGDALATSPSTSSKRPALPNTVIPVEVDNAPLMLDISSSPSSQNGNTMIRFRRIEDGTPAGSSPGVATYRAPEDLNAEPDSNGTANENVQTKKIMHVQIHDDSGQFVFDQYFSDVERVQADTVAVTAVPVDASINVPPPPDSDEEDDWDELPEAEVMDEEQDAAEHNRARPGNGQEANGLGPAQEANADVEANVEDDMDGALEEAIGMRGPITSILQNLALMTFALAITLALGICLPFTIGKTTAILVLEPHRLVSIIHFPIRMIRFVTDPIVDLFFVILRRAIFPVLLKSFRTLFLDILINKTSMDLTNAVSTFDVNNQSYWATATKIGGAILDRHSLVRTRASVFANWLFSPKSLLMRYAELKFALLGRRVRLAYTVLQGIWLSLADGDTALDRLFGVVLGYAVVGIFVALYLNVLNVGTVQSAGRAVRNAVRQQVIIVKVAVFIVIEMLVFPLGCGVVVDFSLLQVFPDATIASRLAFALYAPMTSGFYHWMTGTIFMYLFAVMLGGCRTIMRSGAMWFIKDPQDQSFHPIRDILDRPTLIQIRKLIISAGIYTVVVLFSMGSLVFLFRIFGMGLVPLRWRMREPLSEVPLDLLFLHLVLPRSVHYVRPRKFLRSLVTRYWKWAAHQARFSSYMFGGRYASEEFPQKKWSWRLIFETADTPFNHKGADRFSGGFRRVPSVDRIALPKETVATVLVDENGNALDEAGRQLIQAQNNEAVKAGRNSKDDYMVVYVPPHPRRRLIMFIILMWLAVSSTFVAAITIPVHLGRGVFNIFVGREVHDGYSLVLGFYILWGCVLFGKTMERLDKRRQRTGSDDPRGPWYLYIFKRSSVWLSKIAWLALWLGFLIPTLLAIVVQIYVVNPVVLLRRPDTPLKIHVVQAWAVGLLYTQMALKTVRLRPLSRFDLAITNIKQNGWRRPDVVDATLNLILPLAGGLCAMIIIPIALIWGIQWLVELPLDPNILFTLIYPAIFCAAALARLGHALIKLCASWAQSIRDSEFLIEMRLQNLDHTEYKKLETTNMKAQTSTPLPGTQARPNDI